MLQEHMPGQLILRGRALTLTLRGQAEDLKITGGPDITGNPWWYITPTISLVNERDSHAWPGRALRASSTG